MGTHELAGKPAPQSLLVNVPRLMTAYYTRHVDAADPAQRVAFGTSGHRGSSFAGSFNEEHILAISQAICDYRVGRGIDGPLYLGIDSHALSEAALVSAVEVFAANGLTVLFQEGLRYTPTPVISRAILTFNRGREAGLADGVVITPSHNPPEDGGFKYNPPEGGPADTGITRWIETRANERIAAGLAGVKRIPFARAMKSGTVRPHDYREAYVADLANVVDLAAIAAAGLKIGADPLGGATVDYWERIAERYGLDLAVVNREVDPTFAFMPLDHDGRIRMDCSSPWAMAGLIALKDRFDIAFGNDTDGDRHGIVTAGGGLLNPNHYLAAAIWYLFQSRPGWTKEAAVGKTIVSTAMIDWVARALGRPLMETPVGFKWFVAGLLDGSCGFGGEESAGASFLRRDGTVWTTDKDGIVMSLLACEILAKTGEDPAALYRRLEERLGRAWARRIDTPVTAAEQAVLKNLSPEQVAAAELAGDPIAAKLTRAPANGEAIGGLKVVTARGWFAARPSGTEAIYKLYAESFVDEAHLQRIVNEARAIVAAALAAKGE